MDYATLNYYLIFKLFFMKKLVFAMVYFTVIFLTISCTPDSLVTTEKENLTTPIKTPLPKTVNSMDTGDDKGLTH